MVTAAADQNANVIFGAVIDDAMGDEVRVTVIATGFGQRQRRAAPARARRASRSPEPLDAREREREPRASTSPREMLDVPVRSCATARPPSAGRRACGQ